MPSPISTSTMPAKFTPSAEEAALVAQMFAHGDSHKTNLSPQVLSDIWCIADEEGNGWLSPKRTEVAVRLIGWAQVGVKPTADLVDKPGPLARIPNLAGGLAGPSKIVSSSVIPPFVPEDKDKFLKVFLNSGPVNGLIDGERAREKFLKSNLPPEKLSQIWDLSDTVQRGALNSTEFCIALHLIQGLMTKKFSSVPASLPSGLYQQIEGDPLETKTQSSVMTTPSSPNTSPLDDSKSLHNAVFKAVHQPRRVPPTSSSMYSIGMCLRL
ncbi:hypothetical protein B0H10DRAFT_390591 [Mycena sp. CBHHK59/15]|nr:hypothetical protein B0H10DRAFT_390591 [Mycena sp. CBHHK59/15]